jgi:hypothetical protein
MDYRKHYEKLMLRAKTRNLEGQYVEKHHIVPKCLAGSDDPSNIDILTPEEHFLAHQLLVKMYPMSSPLIKAALLMTTHHTSNRSNNKLFGWMRRQASITQKQWIVENGHPKGMLGKKYTEETKQKIKQRSKEFGELRRVPIFVYNLDGTFFAKYDSIQECGLALKTSPSNVKYTADGKFGICKGKQLRYVSCERIDAYVKNKIIRAKRTAEHCMNISKSKMGIKPTKAWCENHSRKMKEHHQHKKQQLGK